MLPRLDIQGALLAVLFSIAITQIYLWVIYTTGLNSGYSGLLVLLFLDILGGIGIYFFILKNNPEAIWLKTLKYWAKAMVVFIFLLFPLYWAEEQERHECEREKEAALINHAARGPLCSFPFSYWAGLIFGSALFGPHNLLTLIPCAYLIRRFASKT